MMWMLHSWWHIFYSIPSIHQSTNLSIYLSIYPSIYLAVYLSIHLHAGTLLPVAVGQNCKLEFSLLQLKGQYKAVRFSGLSASELRKRGRVTGDWLRCACKRGKSDLLAHWVGPNGRIAENDPTSNVFYTQASRRRGTTVDLHIKHRRFFTCSDAGDYTCVIGKRNRTAVLRPISKQEGHLTSTGMICAVCCVDVLCSVGQYAWYGAIMKSTVR